MDKRLSEHDWGIIVALDIEDFEETLDLVRKVDKVEGVIGYKVGLTSVLHLGIVEAVRRIRAETDQFLVYDHQKAGPDMADMGPKFGAMCAKSDIDGLILFPMAGPTATTMFVQGAIDNDLLPLVGGQIPHSDYLVSGGGYVADDALDRIMSDAAAAGATSFILPANEKETNRKRAEWVAENVKDGRMFVTGIGPLGGGITESFNLVEAVKRRYAIVGRSITAAKDPHEAAKKLVEEAHSAL